jgi:hypothetical protein
MKIKKLTPVWIATFCAVGLLIPATTASAEWDFGLRGGVYNDANEASLGVELLTPIGGSGHWFFNPNVEYVFVDNGDLGTLNFDFHYDFTTNGPVFVWVGGGPGLIVRDPDRPARLDTETDGALNLLGGVGFNLKNSSVRPYVQGKLIISDETESAVAVGIRF